MTCTPTTPTRPTVLFVCVHNAGRSQMAAAYLQHLGGGAVEVLSAGSAPADQVNPAAVRAMAEEGIDITAEQPKLLTDGALSEPEYQAALSERLAFACPRAEGASAE